jgi:hypothetical protein
MTTTINNPKPRHRGLQFSLRGLLLLMVVIAVPLGWTMNKVRQQRDAVAALEKMGCNIRYDGAGNLDATAWLTQFLDRNAFGSVYSVDSGSRFSDAEFLHVRGMTKLESLSLEQSQVTDAGLVCLRQLTRLRVLDLSKAPITDAGLTNLQGLKQLQWLSLRATQVTDSGLANLAGLARLETIILDDTRVTDAGCRELRQAIPKLNIVR